MFDWKELSFSHPSLVCTVYDLQKLTHSSESKSESSIDLLLLGRGSFHQHLWKALKSMKDKGAPQLPSAFFHSFPRVRFTRTDPANPLVGKVRVVSEVNNISGVNNSVLLGNLILPVNSPDEVELRVFLDEPLKRWVQPVLDKFTSNLLI